MVSTTAASYDASVVRLSHGDEDPAGPGFLETVIRAEVDGSYPGRAQETSCGSFVAVDADRLGQLDSITLHTWIWLHSPTARRQGLIARWDDGSTTGFGLFLEATGDVSFASLL
jgi:N,N-dimethylformamidase